MAFVNFRGSGEGSKAGDAGVAVAAGDDGHQFVANEPGVIFVAFDDLSSDQLASDDLKQ